MIERYLQLYSLPENLHQEGSPVLISAGVLLKDTRMNELLVQLKFRNISQRTIRSVKVQITASDTAGAILKGVDSFSYLDLAVQEDGDFGSKTPIRMPDLNTRSFSVKILSVVCADNYIYTANESSSASVASGETLKTITYLDNHRSFLQKQQKEQKLRRLSFLPLIPPLVVFLINCYGFYSGWAVYYHSSLFISFVVPSICLACAHLSKKDSKIPSVGLIFSMALLVLQFIVTKCNIEGFPTTFCGYGILPALRRLYRLSRRTSIYQPNFYIYYSYRLLAEITFLFSYAASLIILYQLKKLYKPNRKDSKT